MSNKITLTIEGATLEELRTNVVAAAKDLGAKVVAPAAAPAAPAAPAATPATDNPKGVKKKDAPAATPPGDDPLAGTEEAGSEEEAPAPPAAGAKKGPKGKGEAAAPANKAGEDDLDALLRELDDAPAAAAAGDEEEAE